MADEILDDPHDSQLESNHSPEALLVLQLSALANEHRLKIVARLSVGREYVSKLARDIGLSRPLTHMHLKRLEEAGLVSSDLELSTDGKAMKYYQLVNFNVLLNPKTILDAVMGTNMSMYCEEK